MKRSTLTITCFLLILFVAMFSCKDDDPIRPAEINNAMWFKGELHSLDHGIIDWTIISNVSAKYRVDFCLLSNDITCCHPDFDAYVGRGNLLCFSLYGVEEPNPVSGEFEVIEFNTYDIMASGYVGLDDKPDGLILLMRLGQTISSGALNIVKDEETYIIDFDLITQHGDEVVGNYQGPIVNK